MKTPKIDFNRAHSLITYNPQDGSFFWKVQQGKASAGDYVGSIQHGYRKATIDKEQIKLHRLAWFMHYGFWPKGQIDHIDGNKLNNSITNLRDVTSSVNMQNRYANKTKKSGLPYGINYSHNGRYQANIRIGTYDSLEEATSAYMNAKRLLHEGCTR